jgi:hypothetical protein
MATSPPTFRQVGGFGWVRYQDDAGRPSRAFSTGETDTSPSLDSTQRNTRCRLCCLFLEHTADRCKAEQDAKG